MTDETPTREGLCVYCGTRRPVTKPICPKCKRTWIDTKIGEEIPALTPAIVAASVEERQTSSEVDMPPPPDEVRSRPWGLLVGVLIGLAIVWLLLTGIFGDNGDDSQATATSTTQTTGASTTVTTEPSTTTEPPTTTTTAATTTTTSATTTTTTTTLPPIEAEGVAIPIDDLTLGAFALGPFAFDAGVPYLGRLVATLGQPDASSAAGEEVGLCADEDGVTYTWDGFTAIFRVENDTEILVGYRLVQTGSDHPSQSIRSRSGLRVGDTVEKLDAIYLQSGLAFEEIEGSTHFLLLRSSDEVTLLWGPVTSNEASGIVEGIYSPRSCDGGPIATP